MKYKRVLGGSLLCILLSSSILIGAVALSRISMAYNYALQYGALPAGGAGGASGTNLSLLIYADPEISRPVLNLFQYVAAENIE